jgi:hypothetical protein
MTSRMGKRVLTYVFLAGPLIAGEAPAAPLQHWLAVSNTASSITGDVQFSPATIVFANHAGLKLTPAGRAEGLTWADSLKNQAVQLYKVEGAQNPRLLNDNYLCGSKTQPTFLSVLVHGNDIYLTAFSGEGVPTLKDYASRICAGFSYALK